MSQRSRLRRRAVLGAAAFVVTSGAAGLGQSAEFSSAALQQGPTAASEAPVQVGRTALTLEHSPMVKAVPSLIASPTVSRLRETAASRQLELSFNLPLRNEAQLDALLAKLYDPASPLFHKYLAPAQFDKQFGPTQSDFDALVTWAQDHGFSIKAKSSNLRILTVTAPVSVVNRALSVTMTDYADSARNRTFFAPNREPSFSLPVPVLGIDGLDNANPPESHYHKGSAKQIARAVNAIAGSGPANQYLPSDMRAAYYGNGPLTGAGQTVAIFSFDGYLANDLNIYYQNTGMTSTVPVTNVPVAGFSGNCVLNTPCDDGEQILDIVQVQGMAPGLAGILFYENSNTANSILNQIATDNKAKVVSSSWSGGGFGLSSDTYFKQMAAQGQSYLNATGDSGGFNRYTYLAPAVDAYITQVGGTDLQTNGAGGSWSSETGWIDSGGGFYGTSWAIPAWQQAAGVITAANGGSTAYRNSPDIAAEANYDNPTVSNGLFDIGYGGTSFATPRYAGYIALANQQSVANGTGTLGFLNPSLYSYGTGSNAAGNYHDITSGTNPSTIYSGTTGTSAQKTYTATAGYDLVTGWGSPNGAGLINSLSGTPYQDFSVSATNPSLTILRNSTVSDNLSITDANGFTGTVSFSATGMPNGLTVSFSPTSSTTGTTITFTSDGTTPFATSNIVVTATSGSLSHSVTYQIYTSKRAGADFTLSAAATNAVIGTTTVIPVNVTLTSIPAPVTLAVSGLPAGVTASFDKTTTYDSANLTLTVAGSVLPSTTANIVITGTYPTPTYPFTHTISVPVSFILPGTQILSNPGLENGSVSPWTITSSSNNGQYIFCSLAICGVAPHSGTYMFGLDGYGAAHTDTAKQTVTIPASSTSAMLSFFVAYSTAETSSAAANDTLSVQILSPSGTVLTQVATLSNLSARSTVGYGYYSYALPTSLIGQTVVVSFTGVENASAYTEFYIDDVALTVQ